MAKKALELCDEITIIVDARTALENIKALAIHAGCLVDVTGESGEIYSIHLKKTGPGWKD